MTSEALSRYLNSPVYCIVDKDGRILMACKERKEAEKILAAYNEEGELAAPFHIDCVHML